VHAAEFDIASAMTLSAAIERGEWVVIMGDRMPVRKSGRPIRVDFLGSPAPFPPGPFIFAAALRCPIYTLFCTKLNGRHRVSLSLLSDGLALPRRNREAALEDLVRRYAAALEAQVLAAPYQWFNFYDYWAASDGDAGGTILSGQIH
jgi:predicted LPLAT superfamily acyltransferase